MSHQGYEDLGNKPLFGEARPVDRVINLIVGVLTSVLVTETLIAAIAHPWPPKPTNVFLAFCVVLLCISHVLLIYWYRQGDLEPKFKNLIYFNALVVMLLCVCGNLFVFNYK